MLLQVLDGCFKYGDVTIFEHANLDVNEQNSIGLVGANGAGKSTLLKCIVDEAQLFSGSIYRKNGLSMGYLKQNCQFTSSNSLFDEMMSVFDEHIKLVEQIAQVSNQLSNCLESSDQYKVLSDKYHRLSVQADVMEAYNVEVKVKQVLNGMGMMSFADRIVDTLSGGEKTKAALCKLLLQKPELLILDEPTNHLDYKTLDWLENFLKNSKSTLILVSHDRYFLDKLCTHIWDVQHQKITCYKGNYTKYKLLKAERRALEQKEYDRQQKEIAKLQEYIDKNKVRASTADMAKSREKALERMTILSAPQADECPPRFSFNYTSEPSEFPISINNLSLAYGSNVLVNNLNFVLGRGQKVALLGLNGSGKSTLIRRIAQSNPQDIGKIIFGKNVRVGFYDQENLNLQGNLRVIDQLWFDNTRMSQTEVRSLLARVTLGADDVYKLVCELSGGERAKLGLAMIMAKDCNVLLLDEPTNHLDLPSREALEEALVNYSGTVLFVSHDRYFVNAISTSIAEIDQGTLKVYQGNYDNFAQKTFVAQNKVSKLPVQTGYRNAKQRAERTNNLRKLKELEQQITQLEDQIDQINSLLASPDVASNYEKMSPLLIQLEQLNAKLEQTMSSWEELSVNM